MTQTTELLAEISALSAEISTTTKADVFTTYYGHTNSLTVSIEPKGWLNPDDAHDRYLEDVTNLTFSEWLTDYEKRSTFRVYLSSATAADSLLSIRQELLAILEEGDDDDEIELG